MRLASSPVLPRRLSPLRQVFVRADQPCDDALVGKRSARQCVDRVQQPSGIGGAVQETGVKALGQIAKVFHAGKNNVAHLLACHRAARQRLVERIASPGIHSPAKRIAVKPVQEAVVGVAVLEGVLERTNDRGLGLFHRTARAKKLT